MPCDGDTAGVPTEQPELGRSSAPRGVSPEHVALGRTIRQLRRAIGISQETLADRTGLHRTYVGGIERGERNPSYTNLLKLSAALKVSPSQLLAHAEAGRGDRSRRP